MGRITEVSYLYLYLILPRSAKISILSYLGDKRGFIFLSYLRYFFKLSSPTLLFSDDSPFANGSVADVAVVYEPRLRCLGGGRRPRNLGHDPGAVGDRAVGEQGAAVQERAEGALQELSLEQLVACQDIPQVLEADELLASL